MRLARRKSDGTVSAHGDEGDNNDGSTPTIEHERSSLDEAGRLLPDALVPALMATSPRDIANRETSPPASQNPTAQYAALLSLTTSRISSIGVALGFFSGVSLLILLIIPISLMGGTTAAMRIAIGVSAAWWAVFTIPALLGLPGGPRAKYEGKERGSRLSWAGQGWKRVGRMITPKEVKRLPNLFTFLFAWIFLSDGQLLDFSPSFPLTELMTRIPHSHVHCNSLRIINTAHGPLQNHLDRCPRPAQRGHLVRSCSANTKQTATLESAILDLDSDRRRSAPYLHVHWADSTFRWAEDGGGDVCRRDMVWPCELRPLLSDINMN